MSTDAQEKKKEFDLKDWLINFLEKLMSRKFIVTAVVIWLSFELTKMKAVSGAEWMSMVQYVILIYVGGNVTQKGVLTTIESVKEFKLKKAELDKTLNEDI